MIVLMLLLFRLIVLTLTREKADGRAARAMLFFHLVCLAAQSRPSRCFNLNLQA